MSKINLAVFCSDVLFLPPGQEFSPQIISILDCNAFLKAFVVREKDLHFSWSRVSSLMSRRWFHSHGVVTSSRERDAVNLAVGLIRHICLCPCNQIEKVFILRSASQEDPVGAGVNLRLIELSSGSVLSFAERTFSADDTIKIMSDCA